MIVFGNRFQIYYLKELGVLLCKLFLMSKQVPPLFYNSDSAKNSVLSEFSKRKVTMTNQKTCNQSPPVAANSKKGMYDKSKTRTLTKISALLNFSTFQFNSPIQIPISLLQHLYPPYIPYSLILYLYFHQQGLCYHVFISILFFKTYFFAF